MKQEKEVNEKNNTEEDQAFFYKLRKFIWEKYFAWESQKTAFSIIALGTQWDGEKFSGVMEKRGRGNR